MSYAIRLSIIIMIIPLLGAFHSPGSFGLPRIPSVKAISPGFDEPWYPAGPAMDTLQETIFSAAADEYDNLQAQAPYNSIDFTDSPIPSGLLASDPFANSPLYVETLAQSTGFNEIEFNLANNFWGCPFNFGLSTVCGTYIRQGIAHLIDKAKFASNEPDLSGMGIAIDNPLSPGAMLPVPNPCNWDTHFVETNSNCSSPPSGGLAYHLGSAAGASIGLNSYSWMQANPSPDFCAGAYDISVGVAAILPSEPAPGTGVSMKSMPGGGFPTTPPSSWTFTSSTDCSLVPCCANNLNDFTLEVSQVIGSHPVDFYYRSDNNALLLLGETLAAEICAIWSDSFTVGCNSVPVPHHPGSYMNILDAHQALSKLYFPGYQTSTGSSPTTSWGMYTAGSGYYLGLDPYEVKDERISSLVKQSCTSAGCDPFDMDLYFTFNSQFVSGISLIISPSGPCSSSAVPNGAASNYMYLCDKSYDSASSQMEYATSLSSAVSFGEQAENLFGGNAYSIPIFSMSVKYAYLNGWTRAINAGGTFNYFTWLNTWNPNPKVPGTIRFGLSSLTNSVNPYIASTPLDFAVLGGIYDNLIATDPYDQGAPIYWMALSVNQLTNSGLTYTPPAGTTQTFRFTLRSDMFFQDGRNVTPFDVAFSYLSFLASGSVLGGTLQNLSGITILGPHQFDLNVNAYGPFTLMSITAPPILPGAYWTNAGTSAWTSQISTCTATNAPCYPAQYELSGNTVSCTRTQGFQCIFPADYLQVNQNYISAGTDPIANHIFVGSGPWTCGVVGGLGSQSPGSGNCSSSQAMNPAPGGSYVFSRFGKGLAPGSSISSIYFRSNGNLATYLWSGDTGDGTKDFVNFSVVAGCFGAAVTTAAPCAHFQRGIGAYGGPVPVGLAQVAIVNRFVGLNWVAPSNWAASPPNGIGTVHPVLYENTITLNPASVAGCSAQYPTGGYDC